MHLSVREAATLLGQSPRTVRARLLRGDLAGSKKKGRWRVDRRELPLTERQRRALQTKADSLRRTLDDALPSRLARSAGTRSRSIADLDAFRHGAEVLSRLRQDEAAQGAHARRAATLVESALLSLAEAVHQYDGGVKLAAIERARGRLARAAGLLLLTGGSPADGSSPDLVVRLESEVLPAVGGLARWADSLRRRRER